jgi:hypothetical protein
MACLRLYPLPTNHYLLFLPVLLVLALARAAPADELRVERPAITAPKPYGVPPRDGRAVEAAIDRGIEFLLADQNKDGSWGSAQRTKGLNIYAPVPGAHHAFRAAVTALCISALIESRRDSQGVQSAIDRGEAWLFENLPHLRRASPDALYNVWGHGYGVGALVRMYDRKVADEARRSKIRELIEDQFARLERYESVDGGWGYYDFRVGAKKPGASSTSFVNAAILISMHEAARIGVRAPEKVVARAVASTRLQMKPDFTYLYDLELRWVPTMAINLPGGSLGRSQACNLALRLYGEPKITDEVIESWLDRLFARNGWLDMGRKRPIPHESHYMVAGYFFYFGHYYAAHSIEVLPAERRGPHQDQLAHRLLELQEKDGTWWDYPLYNYHQQYGTAFALMSLVRCR